MARRRVETFGLSFLDCICCGFGAVILFYTVISAQSGIQRIRKTDDLSAEVSKLEEQVLVGTKNLVVLRNALEKTESETVSASGRSTRLIETLSKEREQLSTYDQTTLARRERIEKLKADVKSLEEGTRRLEGGAEDKAPPGQEIKAFRGTGDRRYITGIRMRGKHILILVDRSASMLHEDLVSVIRLRNSSEQTKRQAAKWRRAVDTVSWLVTQLPPGSQYQIYGFNTKAEAVITGTDGKWNDGGNPQIMARNLESLRALVPQDGTSLFNAFTAAKGLLPRPDQIILITDGLPTQGRFSGLRKYIDAGDRARLFDDAIDNAMPDEVPVDVILLPMKGDIPAAHRFWQLARLTHGTLLMPSKDWP
jgi:von Willebrand factor type A domain